MWRVRLFVIGVKRDVDIAAAIRARARRELPFGPCINWNAPGWRPVAQSTPAVRERVRRSRERLGGARRFLTQHTSDHMGVRLDEPIRTITTKDQWAVVDGSLYRPLTVRETARGQGFPDDYRWPVEATRRDCITGLGNAVPPPLAADVVEAVADAA